MTHFHVLAAQGLQQQLGTRYQPWHHSRAGISHRRVRACSSALENGNGNGAAHAADCPAAWDQAGYATGVVRGGRLRYSDLRMAPGRRGQLAMEPGKPRNVLIIKKPSNELATAKMQEVGEWLCAKGVTVYVESNVYSTELPQFKPMSDAMWGSIDFCITLGGDGECWRCAPVLVLQHKSCVSWCKLVTAGPSRSSMDNAYADFMCDPCAISRNPQALCCTLARCLTKTSPCLR